MPRRQMVLCVVVSVLVTLATALFWTNYAADTTTHLYGVLIANNTASNHTRTPVVTGTNARTKLAKSSNQKATVKQTLQRGEPGVNATATSEDDLLYGMNISGIMSRSTFGGVMDYLPSYKNPCWYGRPLNQEKSVLNCIPYFYILGFPKCGTSSLAMVLKRHPEVAPPSRKEPFWWTHERARSGIRGTLDGYLRYYKNASEKIENHVVDRGTNNTYHPVITYDGTPNHAFETLGWEKFPGNKKGAGEPIYLMAHSLRKLYPRAKLIMLMRNPTDRVYSQYHHFVHKSLYSPQHFHEGVQNAIRVITTCLVNHTLRHCMYSRTVYFDLPFKNNGQTNIVSDDHHLSPCIFLHASMYYQYVKDWLDVFPGQILFIKSEEFYEVQNEVLKGVYTFLDIDSRLVRNATRSVRVTPSETYNPYLPMFEETRRILDEFLLPYNNLLAELLQDSKFTFT